MPVTQRFVHTGLILAIAIFTLSICVLIMGASRSIVNDAGLSGSIATEFHLKDSSGQVVSLGANRQNVHVLIISRLNSPLLARAGNKIKQLCDTFARDPAVTILGVQFNPSSSMLDASAEFSELMVPETPDLRTVYDVDGAVARAYRVNEVPTLFVIDGTGVIRHREAIDDAGLSIATTEIIASLRRPPTLIFPQPTDRITPH